MLREGSSWSISRLADVSINTVSKMLVEAGEACASWHYKTVRGVKPGASNAMKSGASAIQGTQRRDCKGCAVRRRKRLDVDGNRRRYQADPFLHGRGPIRNGGTPSRRRGSKLILVAQPNLGFWSSPIGKAVGPPSGRIGQAA